MARAVAAAPPPGVVVHESDGDPAALLDAWAGARVALLIDAATGGAAPGTLHRFEASADPLPAALHGVSSHGLGVAEAIELGRVLGRLPARTIVFCIEGADFGDHRPLSPAVERAVRPAADLVAAELAALPR